MTVKADAYDEDSDSWAVVFIATERQVDATTNFNTPLPYVSLPLNPCRTAFPTRRLRLTFDTDLTVQWLEVRAGLAVH